MRFFSALYSVLFFTSPLFGDWAEDRVKKMSVEQKIGQLFLIPACPLRGEEHFDDLKTIIEKYHVCGAILKQGDAETQLRLIARMQSYSCCPLLCVGDAEWGLGMRLKNTLSFPKNLTLGAIQDTSLIYELGKEIGRQCKMVGLHINLAPVVDVNIDPDNPIIHMRSFGESPDEVAQRAALFTKGLQESGVAACAKHFIGHGETHFDSHKTLPTIPFSFEHIEKFDLLPFRQLIREGVLTVMTGHLFVPQLDAKYPVSFSSTIVQGLLKTKMGFQGVVISDALNMRALTQNTSFGHIALSAFLAGHDLLLYGDHIAPNVDEILHIQIPQAFQALKSACDEQIITSDELDRRVLKILKFKQRLNVKDVPEKLEQPLATPAAQALKRKLFREAITLLKNRDNLLPLKSSSQPILIQVGEKNAQLSELFKKKGVSENAKAPSHQIVTLCGLNHLLPNFGLSDADLQLLSTLSASKIPTTLVLFGSPYTLRILPEFACLIVAYEDDPDALEGACDVIFGALNPTGKLPVTSSFPRASGLSF